MVWNGVKRMFASPDHSSQDMDDCTANTAIKYSTANPRMVVVRSKEGVTNSTQEVDLENISGEGNGDSALGDDNVKDELSASNSLGENIKVGGPWSPGKKEMPKPEETPSEGVKTASSFDEDEEIETELLQLF